MTLFPEPEWSWVSPWWRERITALEAAFADGVPDDFLSVPAVQDCGLVTNDWDAAAEITAEFAEAGYNIGAGSWTATDLAHLMHLWRAGWPREPVASIAEFGAGFGNVARLTRRVDDPPLHLSIDVPVMARLQYHYLQSVDALDGVGFVLSDPDKLDRVQVRPDVFLASFSLDECTAECHDWLIGHDWLGARTVLVAMQTRRGEMFPDGPGLFPRLLRLGFTVLPCPFDGSAYLRWDR